MSLPLETTPEQVRDRIASGERLTLIDVRRPEEFAIARIDGAELIPMDSVPARLSDLDSLADQSTLIVLCHHGMRSLSVVDWLRRQGVGNCQSMAGGIELWSLTVDHGVARY